jgi:hypothetical protein
VSSVLWCGTTGLALYYSLGMVESLTCTVTFATDCETSLIGTARMLQCTEVGGSNWSHAPPPPTPTPAPSPSPSPSPSPTPLHHHVPGRRRWCNSTCDAVRGGAEVAVHLPGLSCVIAACHVYVYMLRSRAVAMSCTNTDRTPGSRGARGQVVSSPACTLAISGTFACVVPSSDALEGVTLERASGIICPRVASVHGLAWLGLSRTLHQCSSSLSPPSSTPMPWLHVCPAPIPRKRFTIMCRWSLCGFVCVCVCVCVQHCLPRHSG